MPTPSTAMPPQVRVGPTGASPPPTPQRTQRQTPDRPTSHDRPSAPVNTVSPTVGTSGGLRTQQSPTCSRGATNTAGLSPRPESRPCPVLTEGVDTENDADVPMDIDEFDLMLPSETAANRSFHEGPNANSLVAEFRDRLIRDKLADVTTADIAGRADTSKIHVPVAQKPVPAIPRENGQRAGAGNPMGFESPSGPVLSQSATPMPRPGSRAPSACNFCGVQGCAGNCPRAREVSPVMIGTLPVNKSVTPSGMHVTQSPLMYNSHLSSLQGVRLGSPSTGPATYGSIGCLESRSASAGDANGTEVHSPAAAATPLGSTPRGGGTPRTRAVARNHVDPHSVPVQITPTRQLAKAEGQPTRPTVFAPPATHQQSALRKEMPSAASATATGAAAASGPASEFAQPAHFTSATSSTRRARIAHPTPARLPSDEGSTSSGVSTRTQPQMLWEEELKKRSKSTKRRLLRSSGSAWSEGKSSCTSYPSISSPTKAPHSSKGAPSAMMTSKQMGK